ncbi:hypothetical protein RI129_000424 [Pyrocoelia pectoralis]|uniref:SCP domain-containing protein n=1 Tax=Pyrocoelia pectoralis TaxID=417401 RepID=A0AAN7VK58_9COLE
MSIQQTYVDDNGNDPIAIVVLNRHNEYRMKHGVPIVTLSPQHCSETSSLSHRPNNPYGENLAYTYNHDFTITTIAKNGVDVWYNEIQNYTFGTEKVQYDALHFTQIVWKEGGVFMVCNYNPPGNIENEFSWNVFKPII